MSENAHTPGPWRWEYNAKHRSVHLVGGKPRYDLTVMDFERWGMHGAVPRFIEPSEVSNGLMLMHRLCDRQDWIEPFPHRDHHAYWCAAVTHPDARLMATSPELLDALVGMLDIWRSTCSANGWDPDHLEQYGAAQAAFSKATGKPRFPETFCSACGKSLGPGNEGVSSCGDHK